MNTTKPLGPIEVWLTQINIQVTCRVVYEDESTDELSVDSLSMRGAQRELTGYFLKQGYKPVGRWEPGEPATEGAPYDGASETMRRFKPGQSA